MNAYKVPVSFVRALAGVLLSQSLAMFLHAQQASVVTVPATPGVADNLVNYTIGISTTLSIVDTTGVTTSVNVGRPADPVPVADVLVSGNGSFNLSGEGFASTGKLVLGANAANAVAPFSGVLDLTGLTGANSFTKGVTINSGALAISNERQLGATLNNLTFAGDDSDAAHTARVLINGNVTFDSTAAGTGWQCLVIGSGKAGGFLIADGATLTFSTGTSRISNNGFLIIAPQTPGGTGRVVLSDNSNGGIFNLSSTLTIANAKFTNNAGGGYGGAIGNAAGLVTLTNATFTNNICDDGGAIVNNGGTIAITNAAFTANRGGYGGGALESSGAVTTTSATFTGNYASSGGAIETIGGTAIIANSIFTSNTAGSAGGAIHNGFCNLTVVDTLFTSNTASSLGGAILNSFGTTSIISATFTNNSAGSGGAVSNEPGTSVGIITFTDDIFTSNTASGNGGAIWNTGTINFVTTKNAAYTGNTASSSGGFLYLNPTLSAPAIANFDIAGGATLTIGAAAATDRALDSIASQYGNEIINKTGAGTLVLNANSTGYIGATNINAGALILGDTGNSNARLGGPICVNATGTLGGSGTANGTVAVNVTVNSGGSIMAGYGAANTAPQTLSVTNSLAIKQGATLIYNLGYGSTGTSSDLIRAELLDISALTTQSTTIALAALVPGAYRLIAANAPITANATTAFATICTASSYPTRVTKTYSLANTARDLNLTLAFSNTTLTWTGNSGAHTWNSGAYTWNNGANGVPTWNNDLVNWTRSPANINADSFLTGDAVTFDDTSAASAHAITIETPVNAASMTVTTANTYTFTGAPITTSAAGTKLAGATGALTINGSGLVALSNTTDSFEGGITIASGTLQLAGPLANISAATLANNAHLDFNTTPDGPFRTLTLGSLTGSGAIRMTCNPATGSGDRIIINGSATGAHTLDLILPDAPAGATLDPAALANLIQVNGPNTATFTGAFTYGGHTYILQTQPDGALTFAPPELNLSNLLRALDSPARSKTTFTISGNIPWTATIDAEDANWLDITPATGPANVTTTATLTTLAPNTASTPRHTGVTIEGADIARTVIVTQRTPASGTGNAPAALVVGGTLTLNFAGPPPETHACAVAATSDSGTGAFNVGGINAPYEYEAIGNDATLIYLDNAWSLTFAADGATGTFRLYSFDDDGAYETDGTFTYAPPLATITTVTVTPATATVQKGKTQQFTATVTGTNNPAKTVTWTITGAGNPAATTINAAGLLTIASDETATTLTIRATSTIDPAKSGSATVTITGGNTGGNTSGNTGGNSSSSSGGGGGAPTPISLAALALLLTLRCLTRPRR